jgi:hypothetical protein
MNCFIKTLILQKGKKITLIHKTPFPVSPKGEMIGSAPSPVGEGWEGGNRKRKKTQVYK